MRRFALPGVASLMLFIPYLAPSTASAAFTQCPPVDLDTSCQFLFNVTDTETTIEQDASQPPYEGADDALIGIVNNSSQSISSIPVSAEIELFGFEGDGICGVTNPAPGCVVPPFNTAGEANPNAGEPCPPAAFTCAFEEPAGEPAGVTFPPGVEAIGQGKKNNPLSGYEGPRTWYTGITALGIFPTGRGVVHFDPPLAPGESTYFGLESPPVSGFGSSSTLSTTLQGGGAIGSSISVVQGAAVTDSATLGGANAGAATGSVSFAVYTDAECKILVTAAGSAKLSGVTAGPSSAETLAPGKYYWQAHYAGNSENQPATSACGSEILTVLAPTTTTTVQSGGDISGASLTVPTGTPVADTAHIAGSLATTSTGTVSYVLYKDSKCTLPAAPTSAAAETKGLAGPSAAVKQAAGKYYWRASYSGDAANAPSASACGSEVLTVATHANLGLTGSSKKCVSKRHFIIHPKAPKGVKLVSVEEFINGKHVVTGKLTRRHTTVNLRGLPKGAYKVELIAKSSKGKLYEDTRTFHTCVPGKHHKHHKHKK
jgi:hypothetical protein